MQPVKEEKHDDIVWKAAVAAIAAGVVVTAFLVYVAGTESYSALYLKPDSYSNYVDGNIVSFVYGVQCFETKETSYNLAVYLNETRVAAKDFSISGKGKHSKTHYHLRYRRIRYFL